MNKLKVIILFFLIKVNLFSQELVENELTTNHVLLEQASFFQQKSILSVNSIYDTISLGNNGILDDFSYQGPYPDTSIWLDNFVFINRDYPKAPITMGVATFDGLNNDGFPYNFAASPGSSGVADYLTSKPIDLSGVSSVYLSFFYQAQGIGNAPESVDSLVLEFREPGASTLWKHMWAAEGYVLAANDSTWNRVMLPVSDSVFLKKGFQFRFRNYATLSGNVDHWHIDYVYLNEGRNSADTTFDDIAFVYDGTSLLKDYTAMPWKQYSQSEIRTSVPNLIRNNYDNLRNLIYDYVITDDVNVSQIGTFTGSSNILPFDTTHIYTDCDVSSGCISEVNINTSAFPSSLTAPGKYTISHYYRNGTTKDLVPLNDTLRVQANFSNYFSYDDGTAESSYGIPALYGQLAEKFVITVADTLQAIDIYWNPVLTDATLYTFNLMVWANNGGVPGSVIFTDTTAVPIYNKTGHNQFTRYYLQKKKVYLIPGTYYFGMKQNTNQFLNVGVDKNINTQDKIFYNASGTWYTPSYSGSLMLHPVFGSTSDFTGITAPVKKEDTFDIYPNPASDKLFVESESQNTRHHRIYSVIDLYGRNIKSGLLSEIDYIDVSELSNGIYFFKITSSSGTSIKRFIISR